MHIVLGIICFIAGIAGVVLICMIVRNRSLKEKAGRIIVGRKINCKELPGRPNRYIVRVEYEVNNTIHTKTLVTADKNISRCANNEQIKLIYVDKINKVYWAEDKSPEMIVLIILLVILCAFSFAHSFRILEDGKSLFQNHMEDNKKTVRVGGWDMEYTISDRKLTVEDFENIPLGCSLDDIESQLGEPDGWIGSGILSSVYVLQDGSAVKLIFEIKGPDENLVCILLYKGQTELVLKENKASKSTQ